MSNANYMRHYPCDSCGQIGEEILNGHASSATNWPWGFFCSETCIEQYKLKHPNWQTDRAMINLASEYGCFMRQILPKDEWDKHSVTWDCEKQAFYSPSDIAVSGVIQIPADLVVKYRDQYKAQAAAKTEEWLKRGPEGKKGESSHGQ